MADSFSLIWTTPEDAQEVRLPHDAMLAHKAHEGALPGGNSGYRDGGHFCYSKNLKADEKTEKYILRFDGAYENAAVYVNTQLVCRHPYGYTQFYADLTPFLEPEKENEVRVITNNLAPSSRWYSGGGLYRDVYLFTADSPVYLMPDGVRIKTRCPDAAESSAEIEVLSTIKNESSETADVYLKTEIRETGESRTDLIRVEPGEAYTAVQRIRVAEPRLWNESDPQLYFCKTELFLESGGERMLCDTETARFGIRTLEMSPSRGLQVNGKSVKLRGACIHHDNGVIGAAEFKEAELRKIRKLKEAGFNAVRIAHNPASEVLLEVCDELGMYVMNETFDMWTRNKTDYDYANYFIDWWERDLESMIRCSFNHPSVILYSLGNEIPEIGTPGGIRICRMLQEKAKELDDSRYTTVGINGVFSAGDVIADIVKDVLGNETEADPNGNVNEFLAVMDQNIDRIVVHDIISKRLEQAAEVLDITGYNYMAARYKKDVREYPDRMIVGSETYPPQIGQMWEDVRKYPQILGDFTWTGWDYIGEAGVGIPAYSFGEGGFGAGFPCQIAYVGDLDITGERRPMSYYRESVFGRRKDPYIAVQDPEHYGDRLIKTPWALTDAVPCWEYPGMEEKPVRIEVYSPGDETELFLNGRSLGRKHVERQDPRAVYETVYEEGELKAVAYEKQEKIGEAVLKTPGKETGLQVRKEAEEGGELVYLDIECRDREGILSGACSEEICAVAEGALESWLGTGNPKPSTNYTELRTTLWHGKALLVVRKEKPDSRVHITVKSSRESVSIEI